MQPKMMQTDQAPLISPSEYVVQEQIPGVSQEEVAYSPSEYHGGSSCSRKYAGLKAKPVFVLSSLQIATGITCIVCNIITTVYYRGYSDTGQGIWYGVFFVVDGAFGLWAGLTTNLCSILSFMILSIISAVLTAPLFAISPIGIIYESDLVKAMHSLMMILAVFEAVISIISACLCCHALGCCCKQGFQQYRSHSAGESSPSVMSQNQQGSHSEVINAEQTIGVSCSRKYDGLYAKPVFILSALQIATGMICIVCNIVTSIYYYGSVGQGIWCGLLFIVAGAFGLWAVLSKNLCSILSSMILSIISAVCTALLLAISPIGIIYEPGLVKAMYSLMMILAVFEAVISIISASFCCIALGCCCKQWSQQYMSHSVGQLSHSVMSKPIGYSEVLNAQHREDVSCSTTYDGLQAMPVFVLSDLQIATGIICILCNIVTFIYFDSDIGHGIWCGVFFITAGAFGIWASLSKVLCPVLSFMILSVIAGAMTFPLLLISAIGIIHEHNLVKAMHSMMIILAVFEAIISVISASLCCHAFLYCKKQGNMNQLDEEPLPHVMSHGQSRDPSDVICAQQGAVGQQELDNATLSIQYQNNQRDSPSYSTEQPSSGSQQAQPVCGNNVPSPTNCEAQHPLEHGGSSSSRTYVNLHSEPVFDLSNSQIILGIICIICNVIAIVYHHILTAQGIWCGFFFIVTGVFGLWAGETKHLCSILSSMILSIISVTMTAPLFCLSATGIGLTYKSDGVIAACGLMMGLAILEVYLSTVSASLCCWALYGSSRSETEEPRQHVSQPQGQQLTQVRSTGQPAVQVEGHQVQSQATLFEQFQTNEMNSSSTAIN